ncbi:MAG TPA: creatininase family protein [Chloroflexi bacterium]|jgi:creatinine amidohydrolase|nr:creatininase family protein [Chloroflexota bacterium]
MKPVEEILWANHTRGEFPEWAARNTVVIVPIASTEQHGLHLPEDTDQRTVEYVSREAARRLDIPVLVTPTIPFGVSPHHMIHPGTITLSVETTVRVLKEVCRCVAAHGFERILILSGHGGNGDTVRAAALELRHELGQQVNAYCWFDLVQDKIDAITEGPCRTIGHAGEAETSAVLFTAPHLVRMACRTLVTDISDDPSLGTAEKGRRILEAGVEALMASLQEMAAQPGRRVVGIETIGT